MINRTGGGLFIKLASKGACPSSVLITSASIVHPLAVTSAFQPASLPPSALIAPVVSAMPHTSKSLGLWQQVLPVSSIRPRFVYSLPISNVILPGVEGLPLLWNIV